MSNDRRRKCATGGFAGQPVQGETSGNMRSHGEGKGIQLEAPRRMTLEREYIDIDEYVEETAK
jgi:GTP-binding protein